MIPIWIFENASKWFNAEEYLKANPDVAADPYWGLHPLLHWISSGYTEDRTWKGDPRGSNPGSNPGPSDPTAEKQVVLAVAGHGFMCMADVAGKKLIGPYNHPDPKSPIRCIGYDEPVDVIDTGESVIRITVDGNDVLLSTEDNGRIFKDQIQSDPRNYNFKLYKTLLEGKQHGAFDAQRMLGKLILLGGGEIYVEGHGTRKKFGTDFYCKRIIEYKNQVLVVGYRYSTNNAGWWNSTDALTYSWKEKGKNWRFMSGATYPGKEFVWLVGTANYKGGKHHADSAAIWQLNPDGGLHLLKVFPGYDYSSEVQVGPNHKVYWLNTWRWKQHGNGSALMELHNGEIREIAQFEQSEGRGILFDGPDIWVVLRSHGRGGWVYKITGVL